MTQIEFQNAVVDYLFGPGYYCADTCDGNTGRDLILLDIKKHIKPAQFKRHMLREHIRNIKAKERSRWV